MIRRSERNKRKRDVYSPNKDEQVKQKQSNTNNSKTPIDPSVCPIVIAIQNLNRTKYV